MRIVFCGTPEFAVPSLRRLIAGPGFAVEAVITQPDRPRGRGQQTSSSPVKEAALEAGLHVYQPEKIRSESAYEFFKRVAPDAVVIIAYGQIVPALLLEVPRLGWVNLHASLLPLYRGAAPINWAIVNGETRTGLTTMRIDAGMDTGPTLLKLEMEIGGDETTPELARRMAEAGAPLIVETLEKLDRGEITPVPQDNSKASLAPMLKKEDGRIDWNLSAQKIYNRMRGLEPWPGAFTQFREQMCHVWGRPVVPLPGAAGDAKPGEIIEAGGEIRVACGERSWQKLEAVRMEGRKRVTARDFVNGARLAAREGFSH
jgi:methionyl-tRNA formyltransferase